MLLVGGVYRRYKTAVYLGDVGEKMCQVKIGSSDTFIRNIRKTSIAKAPTPTPTTSSTSAGRKETVTIDKQTLENLINDVEQLKLNVDRVHESINRFKN